MSYTIVYDRRFIKCGDLYIPLALYGDNNVTEFSFAARREVRVRKWGLFDYGDEMILASAEKIMEVVARYHPKDSHNGESFTFRGKWLDDAATYRFFEGGIRDAMTIEDIAWQTNENTLIGELKVYQKDYSYDPTLSSQQSYLHTTEEIREWVENAKKAKAELLASGKAHSVYICLGFVTNDPLTVTPIKDRNVPYVATYRRQTRGGGTSKSYVESVTDNRMSYTQELDKALVFQNIDEAYISFPRWARDNIRIIPLEKVKSGKSEAEKNFILSAALCGSRVYIVRRTKSHTYYSRVLSNNLKRFASEKEAMRWYQDKLEGKSDFSDPKVEEIAKKGGKSL